MRSVEARTAETKTSTPKRIRRWAKRPADPNHGANAFLSVRDVHLLLRELESYLRRIEGVPGRGVSQRRRHAQKLVDKLYQVRWS